MNSNTWTAKLALGLVVMAFAGCDGGEVEEPHTLSPWALPYEDESASRSEAPFLLTGSLDLEAGSYPQVAMNVYQVERLASGKKMTPLTEEATLYSDHSFDVAVSQPGRYHVFAAWTNDNREYSIATAHVEVTQEGVADLGKLTCAGSTLEVNLVVDGKPVSDVYPDLVEKVKLNHSGGIPESDSEWTREFLHRFDLDITEGLTVKGLFPGDWTLDLYGMPGEDVQVSVEGDTELTINYLREEHRRFLRMPPAPSK